MTGPENQQLVSKQRAVSNFEAYGNIHKCFKILIVQIPFGGGTFALTKDINDQMV